MQPRPLGASNERKHAPPSRNAARSSTARTERRSVRKIRFTAAEWQLVEERARARGRAPARYVREVASGAVPKVSRTRGNAPMIRELGAIAGALQALKGGDSRGVDGAEQCLDAPLDALVSRVLGVVARLS
jgi:hypothetical protein